MTHAGSKPKTTAEKKPVIAKYRRFKALKQKRSNRTSASEPTELTVAKTKPTTTTTTLLESPHHPGEYAGAASSTTQDEAEATKERALGP